MGLQIGDPMMQVHSYDNPVNALLSFKPQLFRLIADRKYAIDGRF
jgi:hypothetical protein